MAYEEPLPGERLVVKDPLTSMAVLGDVVLRVAPILTTRSRARSPQPALTSAFAAARWPSLSCRTLGPSWAGRGRVVERQLVLRVRQVWIRAPGSSLVIVSAWERSRRLKGEIAAIPSGGRTQRARSSTD